MTTPTWIGLGSNLGDRRAIIGAALGALAEVPGVAVRAVSSYHETQPVGGPPGQGAFLNAAARLDTSLDPHQLLVALQAIEDRAGRVRTARWGARTLDLDILIFGTKFLDTKDLKLPHPRLAFRRFVLAPLAEIAPEVVDTMTRRTVAGLLANLDRKPRLLALHNVRGAMGAGIFRRLVELLPAIGIEGKERAVHQGWGARALESLARKLEALRADRWGSERGENSWGVADFFLDPRSTTWVVNRPPETHVGFRSLPEEPERTAAEMRWVERIREAKDKAVEPMFVVVLPGEDPILRRPGRLNIPRLWPDSEDPDAIIAEILATCRAIEGA